MPSRSRKCKYGRRKSGSCRRKPGRKSHRSRSRRSKSSCSRGYSKRLRRCRHKPGSKRRSSRKPGPKPGSKRCRYGFSKKLSRCRNKPGRRSSPHVMQVRPSYYIPPAANVGVVRSVPLPMPHHVPQVRGPVVGGSLTPSMNRVDPSWLPPRRHVPVAPVAPVAPAVVHNQGRAMLEKYDGPKVKAAYY